MTEAGEDFPPRDHAEEEEERREQDGGGDETDPIEARQGFPDDVPVRRHGLEHPVEDQDGDGHPTDAAQPGFGCGPGGAQAVLVAFVDLEDLVVGLVVVVAAPFEPSTAAGGEEVEAVFAEPRAYPAPSPGDEAEPEVDDFHPAEPEDPEEDDAGEVDDGDEDGPGPDVLTDLGRVVGELADFGQEDPPAGQEGQDGGGREDGEDADEPAVGGALAADGHAAQDACREVALAGEGDQAEADQE